MSSSGSAAPAGPNVFKNILVGVITTVLGATVIYFLGFHDSGKGEKKKKRDATVTAWNSLLQYEKLFQQTANKMICLGETETAAKEVTDEMDQVIKDMGNIKKEEFVDNRMETLVDRRMDSYTKRKTFIEDFYNEVFTLSAKNLSDEELNNEAVSIQKKLGDRVASLESKDGDYITEIKATLEKEYDTKLNIPEFNFDIKSESLKGKWKMNKASDLNISADGSFTWSSDNVSTSGNWSLSEDIINFNFKDGDKLSYTVKGVDAMVLRLINKADGSFAFGCRQ
jgi:predicted ribonuclease YlaK